MKYFLFITLITALLISCAPTKYLTPDQSEKVFSHDVTLSKEEIRRKLFLFINETYYSSKEVIQTDEDGLLTGNGTIQINEYGVFMDVTFIIKYEDESYKTKWIVKNIKSNKGYYPLGYWGLYSEEIERAIIQNDQMMYEFIVNKESEF